MIIALDEAYRAASEGRFPGCTLRFFDGEHITPPDLAAAIQDAEVLGFRRMPPFPFEPGLFDGAPSLRFIQKSGSGTDWFDLDALSGRGILVAANTGFNAPGVAEHALLLILLCLRNPRVPMDRLRQGEWSRAPGTPPPLMLHDRTVGIVGMGAIGSLLARAVLGLGAKVIAAHRRPGTKPPDIPGVTWTSLDDLLPAVDVLTLHVPLTDETRGLIGARELGLMQPAAVLVNTSRGPVVDETALYAALRDGRLRAAGLDVFADEPTAADNPLLALAQVYATPHIAGFTSELAAMQVEGTLANIARFVAGQLPERLVNPEAAGPGRR